jgi:hypothetical protein
LTSPGQREDNSITTFGKGNRFKYLARRSLVKKVLCIVGFLVLASQLPLWGYDMDPTSIKVVPEAIWALATGGGTWVTELQIANHGGFIAVIDVWLYYSGGSRGPIRVHDGLGNMRSVRFSNILATLDALDPGAFDYYGRVGALLIKTENASCLIQVQAKTVNGNFGKTYPGLTPLAGTTADNSKGMVILDIVKNATYRTSVGVFNTSASTTFSVIFFIRDGAGAMVGSYFEKTLAPHLFIVQPVHPGRSHCRGLRELLGRYPNVWGFQRRRGHVFRLDRQ